MRDCNNLLNSPKTLNTNDLTYNTCNCNTDFLWNTNNYPNICSRDCSKVQ